VAKSHPEVGRYLCCFHPCNEILMRLYEIFETSKKQDLTPLRIARKKLKSNKSVKLTTHIPSVISLIHNYERKREKRET